jgi:hypothetical protein
MPSYNESMGRRRKNEPRSLQPGIAGASDWADARSMSAAVLTKVAPAASQRILDDVTALAGHKGMPKQSALVRLEEAIGRDFADRLVAALSDKSSTNRR